MDYQNLAVLMAGIASTFLALLIFFNGRKKAVNISYSIVILTVVTWAFSIVIYRLVGQASSLLWCKILYLSASLIPTSFLYFNFLFPTGKMSIGWAKKILLSLPCVFIIVLIFSDGLVIKDVLVRPGQEKEIIWGSGYFIYIIFISSYFVWSLFILYKKYRSAAGILRAQIQYILAGSIISIFLGSNFNLVLPSLGEFRLNWLGQASTIIWIGFTAYAILKHHLLDIKVIATELFVGVLNLILLINFITSQSQSDWLLRGFILISVLIFSILLIRSVLREVRNRQKMEILAAELKEANEELKQLDVAKSDFISIASHQLRTPLAAIKGFVSMILEGSYGQVNAEVVDKLEKTYESAERLVKLVNDLLDLSHMEGGKMKFEFSKVEFGQLVGSVVEELTSQAQRKDLKLECKIPDEKLFVRADEAKLRQVAMNLIDNAIKYTDLGFVNVALEKEAISEQISINTNRAVTYVKFSVKDSGMGMRPEEIANLFQKFVRGVNAPRLYTEGAGVGLYVAKKIVDEHHGRIWAESEGEGKGSTFFVKLAEWSGE